MSQLTNAAESAFLALFLQNQNWANVGDATGLRGSTAAGVHRLSLHTADPGEAGAQNTNEATYTSYARASLNRDTTDFTGSGDSRSNGVQVLFPECTGGGPQTITHVGIGSDASGAGNLWVRLALTTPLVVNTGVRPKFDIGTLTLTAA